MFRLNTLLAFISGCCAAIASVFGKVTFNDNLTEWLCQEDQNFAVFSNWNCSSVVFPVRIISLLFLLVFNVLMWVLFTKAMSYSDSTIEVTVVNTASNFLFSAGFGWLVFQETFSFVWYLGFSLIIVGLAFIHTSHSDDSKKLLKNDLNKMD